jgi:hypothetical protein
MKKKKSELKKQKKKAVFCSASSVLYHETGVVPESLDLALVTSVEKDGATSLSRQ